MFDGQPTDFLFGSFEFDTDIRRDTETGDYIASALGLEARHSDQSQALNDLNAKINSAMESGTLRPNHG